jgi:hypothetical protein
MVIRVRMTMGRGKRANRKCGLMVKKSSKEKEKIMPPPSL